MHLLSRNLWLLLAVAAVPAAAFAQATRPSGAVANVQVAAVAAQTSIAEIEASASGKGIVLIYITYDAPNAYGLTIDSASLITASSATITPTFVFGTTGVLTSTLREGRNAAGLVPVEGAFLLQSIGYVDQPDSLSQLPIYVPPGKFVTMRRTTVNTALNVTIGWVEL